MPPPPDADRLLVRRLDAKGTGNVTPRRFSLPLLPLAMSDGPSSAFLADAPVESLTGRVRIVGLATHVPPGSGSAIDRLLRLINEGFFRLAAGEREVAQGPIGALRTLAGLPGDGVDVGFGHATPVQIDVADGETVCATLEMADGEPPPLGCLMLVVAFVPAS